MKRKLIIEVLGFDSDIQLHALGITLAAFFSQFFMFDAITVDASPSEPEQIALPLDSKVN